jgi:hypothetical protein
MVNRMILIVFILPSTALAIYSYPLHQVSAIINNRFTIVCCIMRWKAPINRLIREVLHDRGEEHYDRYECRQE